MLSLFTGRRRVGAGVVARERFGVGFRCAGLLYSTWPQAVRAAKAHRRVHPWPEDPGPVRWAPTRRERRHDRAHRGHALGGLVLAVLLAALAFAVVVEALTTLAVTRAAPAPAAPTETATTVAVAPAYVPVPAGPPTTAPDAASRTGSGR